MSYIHMGLVRGGMGACFGQELFFFFLACFANKLLS